MSLNKKKNIVFVSISSDLYGSSKLLLTLITNLKNHSKTYHPIVCLPYEDGLLKDKLISQDVEVLEMPVLKLKRSMLKTLSFGSFFRDYRKAKSILNKKLDGRNIHCVHSNTLATLFGSFYCFRKPMFHVIHVHEIMDRPKVIKYFFSLIQLFFADKVVYNSRATENFYIKTLPALKKKSVMIFNGVERNKRPLSKTESLKLREALFQSGDNEILIGLIGRFNRLKGHKLLIEAFKKVHTKFQNTKLCFIGSPPEGQEHFLDDIVEYIENNEMTPLVTILPFQEDIYTIIDTLDIVVVPSTEPESFGIVAVESMLSQKAVIASNLGGLADVISHNETGILFEPNNIESLTDSILKLLEDKEYKELIELKAYQKAQEQFSSTSMTKNFISLYNSIS